MENYSPKITARKAGAVAGVGAVGVIVENIVDKVWPGLFPPGTVTAALNVIWVGSQNWRKNRDEDA